MPLSDTPDKVRFSLGRTIQVIDYKDTVKYDVSIELVRQPGESIEALRARTMNEVKSAFLAAEAEVQDAAYKAAEEAGASRTNKYAPLPLTPSYKEPPRRSAAGN